MTLIHNLIIVTLLCSVKHTQCCITQGGQGGGIFDIIFNIFFPDDTSTTSTTNTAATTVTTTTTTTATITTTTTTSSSTACNCGVPAANRNRIVGGQAADQNEYPWQVALIQNGASAPFCGGTIISSDTILTAAHCQTDVSGFKVVVGEHDYTDANDGQESITPSSWTSHPDYNSGTTDYDFAIIKLSSELSFSNKVMPACLPDSSTNYDAVSAVVSGWGTTSSGGTQPNVLHEAEVTTRTNTECTTNTLYSTSDITSQMICAAGSGKDSCQGDSGGPLITLENSLYFSLIGVVSWGVGCGRDDAPGVYSRVTSQLTWITSNVSGSTCSKPT